MRLANLEVSIEENYRKEKEKIISDTKAVRVIFLSYMAFVISNFYSAGY
jgi:hypothetical protein